MLLFLKIEENMKRPVIKLKLPIRVLEVVKYKI